MAEPEGHGGRRTGRALLGLGALGLVLLLGLAPGPGGDVPGAAGAERPPAPLFQDGDGPQLPGGPPADPEGTRERADEILARDEYQGPQEAGDTIIDRIRRWISDRIPDVDGPEVGSGPGNGLSFAVVGVVVVAAVGAAVWTLVGARRTRRSEEDVDVEVDVTPLRSGDEWADEAERCLRAGDHRGAVRARYRSLTATLARRGLVADTPGRTAGEQRDDVVQRAPELAPAFDAVADLFERVWFGGDPAGPDESASAQDLADRALAAAPRRADAVEDEVS